MYSLCQVSSLLAGASKSQGHLIAFVSHTRLNIKHNTKYCEVLRFLGDLSPNQRGAEPRLSSTNKQAPFLDFLPLLLEHSTTAGAIQLSHRGAFDSGANANHVPILHTHTHTKSEKMAR